MPNNNVTTLWNGSEQMTGQDAANTADAIIYHTPGGGVSTVQQALDNSSSSVPVGSVMTFDGSVLPGGYEPYQTQEQRDIATLNDNLSGFKFYPTGTQLVALVADDSYYTDTNGKYVLADSTTGQSMIDNVTYKALASTEDCHGEVGADTATPFSSGVDLENISIQGVTANRSFTAIIGHKYLVSVVTYFTGSTYPSISGGTIINESSVYQTYRYVFLKTFLIVATSTTITCTLRGDTDVRDNCITYIDVTN